MELVPFRMFFMWAKKGQEKPKQIKGSTDLQTYKRQRLGDSVQSFSNNNFGDSLRKEESLVGQENHVITRKSQDYASLTTGQENIIIEIEKRISGVNFMQSK